MQPSEQWIKPVLLEFSSSQSTRRVALGGALISVCTPTYWLYGTSARYLPPILRLFLRIYDSCSPDTPHRWAALHYTKLNPVRAGLAAAPEDYGWSNAAVHCGDRDDAGWADLALTRGSAGPRPGGERTLRPAAEETEAAEIRRSTHTGRPLGTPLAPQWGGRPPKQGADERQEGFAFGRQ
jgi:hypothetical protein